MTEAEVWDALEAFGHKIRALNERMTCIETAVIALMNHKFPQPIEAQFPGHAERGPVKWLKEKLVEARNRGKLIFFMGHHKLSDGWYTVFYIYPKSDDVRKEVQGWLDWALKALERPREVGKA